MSSDRGFQLNYKSRDDLSNKDVSSSSNKQKMNNHNEDQPSCNKCHEYEEQLLRKENYIQHLRSYQQMLTDQVKQLDQGDIDQYVEENKNLTSTVNELQRREKKFKQIIEELKGEIQIKDQQLNYQNQLGKKLSQSNLELKKSMLNLEQDILKTDLTNKYNLQPQQVSKSLVQKQQQVLEVIENDFNDLRLKYQALEHETKQQKKFMESLVEFVISCHPQGFFQKQPNLKYIWNWLKSILEEYMVLKSSQTTRREQKQ